MTQGVLPAGSLPKTWGSTSISVAEIIKKVDANDPTLVIVDICNNAVYQLRSDEYTAQLARALASNTHVREVNLVSCSISDRGAESLAEALAVNKSVTSLNLEKNNLNQDGAAALARGLGSNGTLESINLMNQTTSRWGDACLDAFLQLFARNVTLLKITWRLESRKSFALNKLLTRNNEIDRRKKNGMDFDQLLPAELRATAADAAADGAGGRPDSSAPPPPRAAPAPALPTSAPAAEAPAAGKAGGGGGHQLGRFPSTDELSESAGPAKRPVLSRWPPAAAGCP